MTEQDFNKIYHSHIFEGCDKNLLHKITEDRDCHVVSYKSGETICESHIVMKSIGIVLSGHALVLSSDEDKNVLLRRFSIGDVFGVSSVFSSDHKFVSRIVAKGACSVAFISENGLRTMIDNDPVVLYNYIGFLSDRIAFLNKKINFFTSGSAERRLATYLESFRQDQLIMTENMSTLADMLDIGRASLYRAFDKLTEDGFIIRNKNKVTLLHREKMIEYYRDK